MASLGLNVLNTPADHMGFNPLGTSYEINIVEIIGLSGVL